MIFKQKHSQYWYSKFAYNGKTYCRSTKTPNKALAEKLDDAHRNEIITRSVLGEGEDEILFKTIADKFIKTKGPQQQKTYNAHMRFIKTVWDYEFFDVSALTYRIVDEIVDAKRATGVSNSSIHALLSLIRGIHKHAQKLKFKVQPISIPSVKLPKGRLRFLTPAEEAKLLAELDPLREINPAIPTEARLDEIDFYKYDGSDLVVLLLSLGCRYTEAASLEWKQVDFKEGVIHLWRSKTSNETILYMTNKAKEVLQRRYANRASENFVFTCYGKDECRGANISFPIYKAIKRAGIQGATIHTLRHTTLSRLAQAGMSLHEVKEIAGHSHITTTMRYSHLIKSDVTKKAAELLNNY